MNVPKQEMRYQGNNKIRIFHSFESLSEREAEEIIKESPVQRLRNTVELILRVYQVTREELRNRISDNKIKIITQ